MYTVIEYCLKTSGDDEGRGAVSLVGPTGSSLPGSCCACFWSLHFSSAFKRSLCCVPE